MEELGPGDMEYAHRMSEEFFFHIVPKMFASHHRINITVVKMLRKIVLVNQFPTLDEIFKESKYAASTINSRKSTLRKQPYFKDDRLNMMFYRDYYRHFSTMYDMKEEMTISVVDSGVLDEIEISSLYTQKDVMNVLKRNPGIIFKFPSDVETTTLNYMDPKVQYIKFNHIGSNTPVPLPLSFYYKCNRCLGVQRYSEISANRKCPLAECGGKLIREESMDSVVQVFVSQIATDGYYLPAFSLVEIPNGEFTAATLVCRDEKNKNYHVFILAVKEKKYESSQLDIRTDRHAVWQLIDIIDAVHEDRAGFHVHGMDYYKAAIIMSIIANFAGFKSYNVLIAGMSGGAKTVTPKWYYNTVSLMCKVQDVVSVSMPGLVGSSSVISVNNQNIKVSEPGLLSRNEFVVLDELYTRSENRLIGQLKGSLSSPTISKEVQGNRSEITKTASVTATANIEQSVYNTSREQYSIYVDSYEGDPEGYANINEYTRAAMNDNIFDRDMGEIVNRTLQHKFAAEGVNWIDGQMLSDLDRFALLFYVGNPMTTQEVSVPDHIFDTVDSEIPIPELQRVVYTPEVREYIMWCSKIKMDIDDDAKEQIKPFILDLWKNDYIHSQARGMRYMMKTLELSAALCGRNYITQMDFDFVRELFGRTCKWVEIEEMQRGDTELMVTSSDDISMENKYANRLQPNKKDIETFISKQFGKYHLFKPENAGIYNRAVINIECDIQSKFAVDDPDVARRHIHNYVNRYNLSCGESALPVENDNPPIIECVKLSDNVSITEFRKIVLDEFNKSHIQSVIDLNTLGKKYNVPEKKIETVLIKLCADNQLIKKGVEYRRLK